MMLPLVVFAGGCASQQPAGAEPLVPSGFYWIPEKFIGSDQIAAKSQACGRITRDVSVEHHFGPQREGYSNLIVRPAQGSSQAEIDCIVRSLELIPQMIPASSKAYIRPESE